jgi:hypothetical protein
MPVALQPVATIVPVLAQLAACPPAPYRSGDTDQPSSTASAPPPPPDLTGALGAPAASPPAPPLSGGSVADLPGTPVRMLAPEIVATFTNNTAQAYAANGLPYTAYFDASDEERFHEGTFSDNGTWPVLPDGRLCSALTQINGNIEQCSVMYRRGPTVTFQRPDGVTLGSATVAAGNLQGL